MSQDDVVGALPAWAWKVPYDGKAFPGAVERTTWTGGANCQLFAYEVLALHGWAVADLRSDELWFDQASTVTVAVPQPLDLVLFQKDEQPYGAHVGVVVGDEAVLHLCEEIGFPAVWSWADFSERPRYAVRIGFKRPIQRVQDRE
jgi:hypothetical protein